LTAFAALNKLHFFVCQVDLKLNLGELLL
jgi:hypothetical protein